MYRDTHTSQQPVVGLPPGVTVLAGQDAHRLFVSLPGLRADPQQLAVDLTLRHPGAVAVVNLQLEELAGREEATVVTSVLRRREALKRGDNPPALARRRLS